MNQSKVIYNKKPIFFINLTRVQIEMNKNIKQCCLPAKIYIFKIYTNISISVCNVISNKHIEHICRLEAEKQGNEKMDVFC